MLLLQTLKARAATQLHLNPVAKKEQALNARQLQLLAAHVA